MIFLFLKFMCGINSAGAYVSIAFKMIYLFFRDILWDGEFNQKF